MKHPLSGSELFIYAFFWVIMIVGHSALLVFSSDFTWSTSLTDTCTFYPLLAGFGLSYFYVVKYVSPEGKAEPRDILIHAIGLSVVVIGIVFIHDELITRLLDDPVYISYLDYSQVWRIATGILLLSVVVLIYYLAIHRRLMYSQQQKQDSLQLLLKQTEMEMLKFQINPHFIFNSLNSISALTMSSPEKAQEMVIKLSEFFRRALGTEKDDIQTVDEELQQAELYLDIERIRFGDRLEVIRKVEEKCHKQRLPAMILQPLFENAIKHGVYENLDTVEISVSVSCREGALNVTIANTYDPMHNGKSTGTGIGLKNVRTRLELMYGIPDLVTIERTNTHYKVHLLIPQT
jgi:two-component sensor histidine kinase